MATDPGSMVAVTPRSYLRPEAALASVDRPGEISVVWLPNLTREMYWELISVPHSNLHTLLMEKGGGVNPQNHPGNKLLIVIPHPIPVLKKDLLWNNKSCSPLDFLELSELQEEQV